ncbi:ABC transporter substrate-binding protein [Nocardia sp. NPDC058518]|uniref:ABC transporter substrate-binding protein n=1 Tax=Nocardia sp. NPDC058518 TaxID=3346534 RepID=UPI003648BAC5
MREQHMVGYIKKRSVAVVTAVVACVGSVAACTGNVSGVPGETVRLAVSDFENDALDPAMETNSGMRVAKYLMWDSLLEIGANGEIAPGVAQSWNLSTDGLTWTFDIRPGITFHNGEELSADDVQFSLERMMNPEAATGNASLAREQIEGVDLVDADTIAIRTKGVQTSLPYLVSPHESVVGIVMPKDYLLNEGGQSFEQQRALLERAPVGSGPFKFVDRVAGDSMNFEAVGTHWRRTPTIKRVEVLRVSEESTQVSMLQAGEIDVASVSPDQAGPLEAAGMEIRAVEDSSEIGIFFPGSWRDASRSEPAGNPDVRFALSLGINRQEIVDSVLEGYAGLKTTPFNTSPATADIDVAAYREWAAQANAYDPVRARDLLAKAGYPGGFELQIFSYARPGVPGLSQIAEIVAAQWAEIGVKANIVPTDYNSYRPHFVNIKPDDTYNAGDTNVHGAATRFDVIGSFAAYIREHGGAVQSVKDPELEALIDQAAATIDPAQRRGLIEQAYQRFLRTWTVLEVASTDAVFAVNPEMVGAWTTIPAYPFLGRTFETIQAPAGSS